MGKGAVQMRNVPVGWDGPLAGVDDAGSVSSGVSASRQSSSSLSQSDLIAKILATLQPRITSAVQSAVGQTSTVRVAPRPVAVAPRPAIRVAPRPVTSYRPAVAVAPARYGPSVSSFGQNSFTRSSSGSADQSSIVKSVISSLSPRISSAVSSALAGSNRRVSSSRRAQTGASRGFQSSGASRGNIGGLFGVSGQSSVSVQTPEFAIEY